MRINVLNNWWPRQQLQGGAPGLPAAVCSGADLRLAG